jgi:hypothetical protein
MSDWQAYWAQYDYTKPVEDALKAEFGVSFGLWNTGGGCICLGATLEGGYEILVGSGIDGPLWRNDEREQYKAEHGWYDGYGVGVYDSEDGYTLAYVSDALANDTDVPALLMRALSMVPLSDSESYATWERKPDGTIAERRYPK